MNTKYTKLVLFIAGLAAFASCSTAYKMGQTPDDVYYSPAKPQSEYASNDRDREDDSYYTTGNSSNNRSPPSASTTSRVVAGSSRSRRVAVAGSSR